MQEDFSQELANIRDQWAPHYDALFGDGNASSAAIRGRYLTEVTNRFSPGSWILVLGCGDGRDIVDIAKEGIKIWAVDWSPAMVALAQKRVDSANLGHMVTLKCMPPHQSKSLLGEDLPPERLDGAYAPWGVLNQEQNLPELFDSLYAMIRPSGQIVAGLLNQKSLYGALGAMARGDLSGGLGRLKGKEESTSTWKVDEKLPPLPVHFPTAQSLKAIYGTRFSVEKEFPLGMLTPPPGKGRLGGRGRKLLGKLGRLERALAPVPAMGKMADQKLLIIRRTIEGVWGPQGPQYLAN